ncbi:ribonucleases P/MRP protein subunit POP1 [Malaya genurostris]|uniref:ribonucleases P/MRP protein subunit POP1 n=1 Tax=Malaya genurostris TaxID=325434 RepID=UPI0026F3E8D6|nr:ribonucleases P/MRP protein subunit POP1 [Malaya genurostris]
MASDSLQYDAALGGSVQLPDEVDSERFNEERIIEIKTMLRNIASTDKQTKLMHQSLPLHMRRRAMTYNPKRLPRKFRVIHLSQFSKSGQPERKKRPSRKYRRKANVLLEEYERRKRTNVWLETHIWHAKRFHMLNKWGYKIPFTPTSKAYRACYRATSKHCLLQDVSYFGCIEIQGEELLLSKRLKQFCSEKVGLTIVAKAFLEGKRSGYVWIFERDKFPYKCIGKIRFLWRAGETDNRRTLWLFAHPVFYRKLVVELVNAFNLKDTYENDMEMDVGHKASKTMNNPGTIRIPKYVNDSLGVTILELKDTINYFRLTGPLSHSILSKALKVCEPSENVNQNNWYSEWFQQTDNKNIVDEQFKLWHATCKLTSSGELSPGIVFGLVIKDPRLNRPCKRTKAIPSVIMKPEPLPECNFLTACSPLWNTSIRDRIAKEMQSTHALNSKKNKECLVPGEYCSSDGSVQPIPIILMQNTGSQNGQFKRLGYGAGWDLIAPAGYGLPLWQTLIMWGAKPAGVKELDMQALETGVDLNRIPDTVLGKSEADIEYEKKWSKYFARPSNRRVNYKKIAIASPFRCPWSQLVSEWSVLKNSSFFVLRDQEVLSKVQMAINRRFNIQSAGLPSQCLIPISLTMKSRGNPGDNALICLPHRHDFRQNKQQKQVSDNSPVYIEELRKDPNQKERLLLRRHHLKLLKRLRCRRIREKKIRQRKNPGKLIRISKPNNQELVKQQLSKMRELWLPEVPETIRNQCSRECFGYVTQCSFSLTEANVAALGYVTADGLKKLFKICSKGTLKVLVRGTKSRCYRFASFKIQNE